MPRTKIFLILLIPIFSLSALIGSMASAQQEVDLSWQDKVDAHLLAQLSRQPSSESAQTIEFIIQLAEQAEITVPADVAASKDARGRYVYNHLTSTAAETQSDLLKTLNTAGAKSQPFIIVNAIHVVAPSHILPDIAIRPDVAFLHANPVIQFELEASQTLPFLETQAPNEIEWGIDKIGAPLLWADGITGTNVIIAGQDTGYNWDHPALKNSYRGWDGSTADHNYSWHDAISADIDGNNNNPCGYAIDVPCDDIGSTHGTHTMGTMTGADGDNQIGVAPGAQWIGCRNMEQGSGTPTTYINCFEWFLAPTDLADANPNPALAPHVINNSWGCPPSEGCNSGNFEMMNIVIENLRAAGIVVVTSAGNSGSSCSSVSSPAAIFDGSFSVGATDSGDGIASFSSRGPVTADDSGRVKPNVTAPGVLVRSSVGNSGYASYSGTSMAGPHVAGAVGLMISAFPPIAGNIEAIETYLEQTADYIGLGNCGGTEVFNNTYGHGRINVHSAAQAIWNLDLNKSVPAAISVPQSPNATSNAHLTYTLTLTKTGPMITFTNTSVTDTLPAGTTFISATQPVTLTGQTLSWPIGEMGPESVQTLEVTLALSDTQGTTTTIHYPAAIASAEFVPEQAGNSAESLVTFEENPAMLFTIKRDIPASLDDDRIAQTATGTFITYTISITAPTEISPTNTILTETLPIGADLLSASEPVSSTASGLVWQLGDLSADQSVSLTVVIQISSPADLFPSLMFPAAQVTADNVPLKTTPIMALKPIRYWFPTISR